MFNTTDGFALDVFVVDGWNGMEVRAAAVAARRADVMLHEARGAVPCLGSPCEFCSSSAVIHVVGPQQQQPLGSRCCTAAGGREPGGAAGPAAAADAAAGGSGPRRARDQHQRPKSRPLSSGGDGVRIRLGGAPCGAAAARVSQRQRLHQQQRRRRRPGPGGVECAAAGRPAGVAGAGRLGD